jgi:predicted transposase YdaD
VCSSDLKTIGLAEGEAIGLKKGKAEGETQAMIKVVLNSHAKGLSLETIVSITGFTENEITEILKQQ